MNSLLPLRYRDFLLDLATLMSRKYLKFLKYLISKSLANFIFYIVLYHQYKTIRIVILFLDDHLMNKVWSPWLCWYPNLTSDWANLWNHPLEIVLTYIMIFFFSLHAYPLLNCPFKPRSRSMKTFSSIFPCKKGFLSLVIYIELLKLLVLICTNRW